MMNGCLPMMKHSSKFFISQLLFLIGKYGRDTLLNIKNALHMIPCFSTENCTHPPKAGSAISVTTTDVKDSEWMKTEAEFECKDPESFFYEELLDYEASFSLTCEKNLILGGKFPYWKIPGTDYPNKNEVICAHPKKCYNFAEFDPSVRMLGLSDTFDSYHYETDAKYEYFCSNENRGGK